MIGYGRRRHSLGQSRRLSSDLSLNASSRRRLSSALLSPGGALPEQHDSDLINRSIGEIDGDFKTSFGSPDAIQFDDKILKHAFSSLEQYVSHQHAKIDSHESPANNASGKPGSNESKEGSINDFSKDDLEALAENLFSMFDGKENDGGSKLAAASEINARASTPRKSLGVLTPRNKGSIDTPPRPLLKGFERAGSFSLSHDAENQKPSQTEPSSCSDKNTSSESTDDAEQVHTMLPPLNDSIDAPKQGQQAIADADTEAPVKSQAEMEEDRAYSVWKARGLMGRQKTPPRVKAPQSHTIYDSHVSCTSHQSNELDPPPTIVIVTTPDQDDLDESITESEAEGADQHFSDMLHQWQDKSDHNPNGHFLSQPVDKSPNRGNAPSNLKVDADGRHDSSEIYHDSDYLNRHDTTCTCTTSIFSGNGALVDFYLPKLGMACTCGKQQTTIPADSDPMLLEHILRPWQVEFLSSFGIRKGDELVKVYHRRGDLLAKALKLWRRERGMPNARTDSCNMALQIWSRTSKVYVRSVRTQLAMGKDVLDQPDVLEALSSMMGANKAMSGATAKKKNRKKRRSSPREAIEPESQAEI